MTICETCDQVMLTADGCEPQFDSIPFGQELPNDPEWSAALPERCGDCNALQGQTHHLGCCVAVCGTCNEQLLTCEHGEALLGVYGYPPVP
jgi:hypothetical protein